LLINGRADVALAVGADGVHLTSDDPPVAAMRALLGPEALIGVSTHHMDDFCRVAGADFVTFGPVYDTPSKRALGRPVGVATLADAVALAPPIFALGGIKLERLDEVAASGCHGVALISQVLADRHPGRRVRGLLETLSALPFRRQSL